MLILSIDNYLEDGKFSTAARHTKTVAEMFEEEGEIEKSLIYYKKSIDLFETDNTSNLNQCKIKVGEFSAILKDYKKAVEIFEEIAISYTKNHLLKFNAKEYFLRAGICLLLQDDLVASKRFLQKYHYLESFESTLECKLLEKIVDCYEKYDVISFTNSIQEYDKYNKLDLWKSNLLLKIKNNLNQDEELF